MLSDLLALASARNYLALAVFLALYLRKILSDASKFPITIPVNWRPTVTAGVGLLYVVLASVQSGKTWGLALLDGLGVAAATGFFDGLLIAIFNHDNAPSWANALVFIVKDLGSSSKPSGGSGPLMGAAAGLAIALFAPLGRFFLCLMLVGGFTVSAAKMWHASDPSAVSVVGCTKQEAKSVGDAVIDNAPLICAGTLEVEQLLNLDEDATKKVCNVVEETAPFVKRTFDDIVGAKKAAAHKAASSGVRPCK